MSQNTLDFGQLTDLMSDPHIVDIAINRYDQVQVWHSETGRTTVESPFQNEAELQALVQQLATQVNRKIGSDNPVVELRLPDASRMLAIIPPVATYGTVLKIDKHFEPTISLDWAVDIDAMSQASADFLKAAIQVRANIAIVGGYRSGKTTILNVLAQQIPEGARIIAIQPTTPLTLSQPHVVSLESRPANLEGKGAITNCQLLGIGLRLNPDRFVIGELDGSEFSTLVRALNLGDSAIFAMEGIHPRDALNRLELMAIGADLSAPLLTVREQMAQALDLIVQMHFTDEGLRRMVGIYEVNGLQGDSIAFTPLFERANYSAEKSLAPMQKIPYLYDRIQAHGIELDTAVFDVDVS